MAASNISKIFLLCLPKCATKSSRYVNLSSIKSSSEQTDQIVKSDNKIEHAILPVIPNVLFNDEIESNLLSTDEDRIISKGLLPNINEYSISDDSQSPKCLKCNEDLSSWDCVNGVLCNFWCNSCESQELQRNFSNWTSGNSDIDKLVQESQLNIGYTMSYLEWIPFDRLTDMKFWERGGERTVAVKRLHNSANINPEFLNELKLHLHNFRDSYILQYFGISRHLNTGDFMIVMEFANRGNLRNYLQSVPNLSWSQKIDILESLVIGLSQLHNNADLSHKNFHPGNILISNLGFPDDEPIIVTSVSDFGLTKPAKLYNTKAGDFYQQFKEADENKHIESPIISIHAQAIYNSRPLKQFTKHTTISYEESLESNSFYEHSRHNSTGPLIQHDDI
ncbi:10726_t:CDS:2 [Dentiscutata erythropus]|uniref:10726_t:CDS:1 n=1 Tax=Dentiscutata erythropus TaxID=1348616 RepID=A0A9N9F4D2_9GLOM|nr:10726_t:CDS:2 [Dentiscutata erythropus]